MADMMAGDERGVTTPERLSALREMFAEARDQTAEARGESETDLDYYHEHQWSASERKTLKDRKQPIVTFNAIKAKVESICGVEEQAETAPKAWPRTPADEQAAQVATDTLRYVCDINRFDKTRIDALRDCMICGTGGVIVEVEQKAEGRYEIKVRKLRWETIFYDPYSRETDFSDARYVGCAAWMNAKDVVALYGDGAKEVVDGALSDNSLAEGSFEDRPNSTKGWADRKNRRILVVEVYNRVEGVWHHSVFTGYGVIVDGESPYVDADGNPTCPIELVSAYVDRENNRYGEVRGMRSAQDEINHRRSKLLHLLNTKQTFRREGTIGAENPQALRRELNKPDGDIVIGKTAVWGEDIGIIDHGAEVAGQAEMLQNAWQFIDKQGANQAMMGRTENQSGRAILAQQQAGLQTLATIYSSYGDWILRVYKQIWARTRQFWTAPMFVRVTDDLDAPKFIQVNEPVFDEFGSPVIDPGTGQPQMTNRIALMDVDLIIDRTPASANIQQEEFAALLELAAQTGMAENPEVKIAIVSASSLRPKAKKAIIDAIQKTMQPPDPQQIQLMVRKAMAEIAKEESQAVKNTADAQKTQAETQLMGLQSIQRASTSLLPMQPPQPQIAPGGPPQAMPPPMPPDQGMPMEQPQEPPQPGGFFNGEIPQ